MASASSPAKAQRQKDNEHIAVYFAVGVLALIVLLSIVHWTSFLLQRQSSRRSNTKTDPSQRLRRLLLTPIPIFKTLPNALLFLAYLAINISLCFSRIPWPDSSKRLIWFAKRAGWVTAINMALTTLLSLRNTPLSLLTGASYERLRPLHNFAGYTTAVLLCMHAVPYIVYYHLRDSLAEDFDAEHVANRMGAVAGVAMLLTVLAATTLRRLHYELFYIAHVVLFLVIIVTYALHRPKIATHSVYIAIFAAAIWFLDRLIRAVTLLISLPNNTATIHPLPNDAVRVTLAKTPSWSFASLGTTATATSGQHVYLYVPAIRAFETHPFTLSSKTPASLVLKAHDGFTRALHEYAVAHPGAILRAGVDGPYGKLPHFSAYDKVVLFAGGSGATFTFGVISALEPAVRVDFIWTIRHSDNMTWFSTQLAVLRANPSIRVHVYVTSQVERTRSSSPEFEKSAHVDVPTPTSDVEKNVGGDIEKSMPELGVESSVGEEVRYGRPDIDALVKRAVGEMSAGQRVIVASCGPQGLMRDVKEATRGVMRSESGVSVQLYEEAFEW
ncbi:hypothetical protein EJ05DRAFT_509154 [Pseudovirgaria hyperparasitica]|uniref:FAD-binding FR-type domain-containing protein n=1 Tax=Pseudovirgaria hyperparasitica TaxID=470096 RepID=A0A6A6WCU2_9PEZI|nr:uncharacterized protein EJ05DRAFT_509154 [Pseudovirgaria hyperparasitica]KAF2760648.1 hypothetical protein EJ05DRAFT_509154 [Pseudovirgaria hyperparasitica]